jgi:hypothetical protein
MLLFDPAPAPLLEPPEYLRRSLEVVSTVGAGVAEGRVPSETGSVGSELALFGFYRPSPYFAAGAGVRWNAFPAWPTGVGGGARFAGAAGRLYFLESGASEPYFGLEVGVSSLRIDEDGGWSSSDLAGAARGSVGVDFYLGAQTRLGPSFGYTRYTYGRVERCAGYRCQSLDSGRGDLPSGVVSLGINLTFGAGDPL